MESLILLVILLFASAFFSSSETALFSLSTAKIKAFRSSTHTTKQLIGHLLERPRDLLVTVFLLNTLVNILVQNVTSSISGEQAGWGWKVLLPFVLLLLLGEIIPKYIGLQLNVSIAQLCAPLIQFIQTLIAPIRRFVVAITIPISHVMFFYLKREPQISHEELMLVLKKSQEHGVLTLHEAELVRGYLQLHDASVKEVMRPREEMLYYDIQDPISKLQHLFVDKEVSRLPVCDGDIQNIKGIVTASIFFMHSQAFLKDKNKLLQHLSKPEYTPENTPARFLLQRLEKKRQEISLVVDEYGGITGLITYEDLVELLIGEITDLRDQEELFTTSGDNAIITSGKLELITVNSIFGSELSSPNNMVTIGGWLTEKVGAIPKSGFKCEYDGFLFHVLSADVKLIRKLYIRMIKKYE